MRIQPYRRIVTAALFLFCSIFVARIVADTPDPDGSRPSESGPIAISPETIEHVLNSPQAETDGPRPVGHPLLDELTASTDPDDLSRRPLELTPATVRLLEKVGMHDLLRGAMVGTSEEPIPASTRGTASNIVADRDNTLYESLTGDFSNGAGPNVFVGNTLGSDKRRAVLHFDIAGNIPAGSTVTAATLTLHVSNSNSAAQSIALHSLTSEWGEGTSLAGGGGGSGAASTTGDATWIHTFWNTDFWTTAGGDYDATASATQTVGGIASYTWSSPQMVVNVQNWLDRPSTNFGWIVIGNEAVSQTAKRFNSRESTTTSFRPTLSVTVTTPDLTPPTVVVVSPNGGESLPPETATMVSWTASDASGISFIDVFASYDNGSTFKPVALGLSGATTSVTWFPDLRPTTTALIRVEATDTSSNLGSDQSDVTFTIQAGPGGLVNTTLRDFDQPGTQPFDLSLDIRDPDTDCANCHGNFGTPSDAEPYFYWRGSMMANASRDPLFEACLTIANQDAPGSGDLCIRCHVAKAWLNGRSTPTSGSQILSTDRKGVSCDVCHRMVDPIADAANPPEDAAVLSALDSVPADFGTARYVIDPNGLRRGPTDPGDTVCPHPVRESPFHREAALCGTCHNVSNPAFEYDGNGNYVLNTLDSPTTDFSEGNIVPIERTYSEWLNSDYNTPGGVYSPVFGGAKDFVSTCQDCHMRDVGGESCSFGNTRPDMPQHDFAGGSTWMMAQLATLFPADIDAAAQNDAIVRARRMLQNAAELDVEANGSQLTVNVTNQTGHKLPTGYPEGRRMWLNVQFYDADDVLIGESAAYDPGTGDLTHDAEAKIYQVEGGLDNATATATGLPEATSFHFVLNNKVYLDNRIPPRGFTNAAYATFGGLPVDHAYADGQYWDETAFTVPDCANRIDVKLYYQSTNREYVEFLRDENTTDTKGQDMYDLWNNNGKSPPELMAELSIDTPFAASQTFAGGGGPSYTTNGDATVLHGACRLTDAVTGQLGSVVFDPISPDPLGSFKASFDFRIGSGTGADGLSFALLDDSLFDASALFDQNGPGVGSLVIKFDTLLNGGEPGDNFVALIHDGVTLATYTPSFDLDDNQWRGAEITLGGSGLSMTMFDADGTPEPAFANEAVALTPFVARYGFGAATGSDTNEHWVDRVFVQDLLAATNCPLDCGRTCGDIDGSTGNVDLTDFAAFAVCFQVSPIATIECACSDLNGDGAVDLLDFATFAQLFGQASTDTPPNCS